MKKMLYPLLCFTTIVFSGAAFGNSVPVSGTSVVEVGMYTSGRIFVKTGTNGTSVNPAGCSSVTFALSKDEENFEEMYKALLLVVARSGSVNLRISTTDCIGTGTQGYPRIVYVGVTS